jgi:plastocyanin
MLFKLSTMVVVGCALALAASVLLARGAAAGGGGCHARPLEDHATVDVRMTENCFSPAIARVGAGTTVTFTNDDRQAHLVVGANYLWGGNTDLLQGDAVTQTFPDEGTFPYSCPIHPGMVGAIVVGDGAGATTVRAASGFTPRSSLAVEAAADESGSSPSAQDGGGDAGAATIALAAGIAATLALMAGAVGGGVVMRGRRGAQK